jgi:hypothetical protein
MDLPRVFATKHVFWGVQPLQLFQVEVVLTTVPMYAVSERTQAFAQVFGKLMVKMQVMTNRSKRYCLSFLDQLLLSVRLTQPPRLHVDF